MPEIDPVKLANSVTKSKVYFHMPDGTEKENVPNAIAESFIKSVTNIVARNAGYKFDDFTGTYLAKIRDSIKYNCTSSLPVLTWRSSIQNTVLCWCECQDDRAYQVLEKQSMTHQ